jgi:acyl-coenzyme A synthetase/AMP-(fatty) acid ligase
VEEVLLFHPAIKEACVVGVADKHSGEKVKALIVAKDDSLTKKASDGSRASIPDWLQAAPYHRVSKGLAQKCRWQSLKA